jgi:ComF family protein
VNLRDCREGDRNLFLSAGLTELKEAIWEVFFPAVCHFCTETLDLPTDSCLCSKCLNSIQKIPEPFCGQCGLPLPGLSKKDGARICGKCLSSPPAYTRARCAALHEGLLRDAVLSFKFGKRLHLAKSLSALLFECFQWHFQESDFDLIVPIPIHRRRLRSRGFNQSLLLAHRLSGHTGIEVARDLLRKTVNSPPQVRLGRNKRIANIKGSFGISDPRRLSGSRILLIDDVITTGATIGEAAKTLIRAKAARVDALVLTYRSYQEDEPTLTTECHPTRVSFSQILGKWQHKRSE